MPRLLAQGVAALALEATSDHRADPLGPLKPFPSAPSAHTRLARKASARRRMLPSAAAGLAGGGQEGAALLRSATRAEAEAAALRAFGVLRWRKNGNARDADEDENDDDENDDDDDDDDDDDASSNDSDDGGNLNGGGSVGAGAVTTLQPVATAAVSETTASRWDCSVEEDSGDSDDATPAGPPLLPWEGPDTYVVDLWLPVAAAPMGGGLSSGTRSGPEAEGEARAPGAAAVRIQLRSLHRKLLASESLTYTFFTCQTDVPGSLSFNTL
jgi:hypothetical protein